ncbi:sigma factor [Paracoccus fontiphilus]|uniref:Sigma factor n=2 Tax=Paracoccus fontiphilus TaxID=1815556 RepID=A0ABV7IDE7_9RHOB
MPDARGTMLQDQIGRVAQGDRHAFDELYQATSARLNAVCLSVLRDRREAEEVLEQVYIDIWKTARDFAGTGLSPATWLVTVARDRAIQRSGTTGPALPATGDVTHPARAVRSAYLQGMSLAEFSDRAGIPADAARQRLHEGFAALGASEGDDLLAAELALGMAGGTDAAATSRLAADPAFARQVRDWQERLALFADDLTPVMAPARARQRIRESLGHGTAPLSVDPLERTPWWRGTGGIVIAILLATALGWYLWTS